MNKKILLALIIPIIGAIIYNYIYLNNYNFKLNGNDTILLNVGDSWEDPLYTTSDNRNVKVSDNIDYNQEGEYQVKYALRIGLFKKTLTRKIIVSNNNNSFQFNLKGDNPYYLAINNSYEEAGYDAYDTTDGNLSQNVMENDNIDNQVDGTYEVKYHVKNSSGVIKTLIRKVVVYSINFEGKLRTNEYSHDNDIIISINDSKYSHTILPDGTKTQESYITYKVEKNDTYLFNIYDMNNNTIDYSVNITNIDNEEPTGNCALTLTDNNGQIKVVAEDNGKIDGYEYSYGNNKTKLQTSAEYTMNTLDNSASVTIYDTAGNSKNISCNIVDNSTKMTRNYTLKSYSNGEYTRQYWLYEPNITKRSKVPLVIYYHGAAGNGSTDAVNSIAIPKNIKDGHDFPYYVIAPFNGPNGGYKYNMDLINYLIATYPNIDSNRIIVSGGSAGTYFTVHMVMQYPTRFSGAVIIAGTSGATVDNVSGLTKTPIWVFQGKQDSYVMMTNLVNSINNAGGNAKITPYEGGHDAPVNAFLREDLTNWILNNKVQ